MVVRLQSARPNFSVRVFFACICYISPMSRVLALLVLVVLASQAAPEPPPKSFGELVRQATSARNSDRAAEAIALYRQAVRMRPAWDEGWLSLGSLLYEQDRFPEAQSSFSHFVAIKPAPGPAWAMKGLCEFEMHDYGQAMKDLEKWGRGPSHGSGDLTEVAAYHWAMLLTQQSEFERAFHMLADRAERDGESPALTEAMGLAWLRMADLPENYPPQSREQVWLDGKSAFYASIHDVARSQEYSRRLLDEHGQQPSVEHREGTHLVSELKPVEAARSAGGFEQYAAAAKRAREDNHDDVAVENYRKALEFKPEWSEGLWYLGTLLYQKDDDLQACTMFRRFLTQNPSNGDGWAMLGFSEYESHQYLRALDHLQQSEMAGISGDKKLRATVSYVIAILLTRAEKFDAGMDLLLARVASGADTSSLVEPLGLAALRLPLLPAEIPPVRREMIRIAGHAVLALEEQHYDEADKFFDQLKTSYPDQSGVHFLIGVRLLDSQPEDGIKELKREIEISPSHLPARLRIADQYIKQLKVDQGIEYAREALRLAPNNASAHMELGEGMVAKGDAGGGIRELEIARNALPDMVRIHWDLVRAYTTAGRTDDADREKAEIERISKQNTAF